MSRSFAREIRDETAARLAGLARYFPAGSPGGPARVRKGFVLPTRDEHVPCIQIYVPTDTMAAEGDNNAGHPRFEHSVRLVVSAFIKANEADDLDEKLDEASEEILETLLSDPTWGRASELFEGIAQIERSIQLLSDERTLLMAEARTIFTITYRSDWPPTITDDFDLVALRTGPDLDDPGADIALP